MPNSSRIFKIEQIAPGRIAWGDVVVIVGIAGFLYMGVRLASGASEVIKGPTISLSLGVLPIYAALIISPATFPSIAAPT